MMSDTATVAAPVVHDRLANALRFLAADAVQRAKSGHPGMPMGMADAATVLFREFLRFDAAAPDWPDRDRLVLSAGHGSMLLYGALYLLGYPGVTREELENFRQLGSRTPGHPEYGRTPGVETTTGPLGQGLANAVGMALAERILAERFGPELVDHRTWVIAGDGDHPGAVIDQLGASATSIRFSAGMPPRSWPNARRLRSSSPRPGGSCTTCSGVAKNAASGRGRWACHDSESNGWLPAIGAPWRLQRPRTTKPGLREHRQCDEGARFMTLESG